MAIGIWDGGSSDPAGGAPVWGGDPCKGDKGDTGATGATGVGIVAGGTEGQIYTKQSSTDYDAAWQHAPVGLPTATTGQIPVYDGSGWTSDTQWLKSGSNIS